MARKKPCTCIPHEEGYYWASDRIYPERRLIVLLGKNGIGHLRAYTCRNSSSRDLTDFTDYSKRIVDPSAIIHATGAVTG